MYRNLLIQYTAIGLGVGAFTMVALLTSVTSYRTSRTNTMAIYVEAHKLFGAW